jgi:hypothetical protein
MRGTFVASQVHGPGKVGGRVRLGGLPVVAAGVLAS